MIQDQIKTRSLSSRLIVNYIIHVRINASFPSLSLISEIFNVGLSDLKDSFCKLTRPGNEAFILRKKLSADQDMIKFLRQERSFYFAQWGLSNLPLCKRARDDATGRFSSGVSMEGAGTRGLGSMEEVNEADDRE